MIIVLDTNILVSAPLNPESYPAHVLNAILNEKVTLLFDNRILEEYKRVLLRPRFGFSVEIVGPLLDYLESEGEFVAADYSGRQFEDDEDKKFYEVAVTGGADYLVTGNIRHFPNESLIITPKDFTERELGR
ncbi:MAG: putative toxin-antitoxin system toxin component, PIN family [Spirochaetia bacterium]|nr:putative toxin-antitoxin system toxin component, PIN family [Spirochaetia bacterium]